ncbi:MAG: phage tail tape measure protein [Pirellulales bacterium]
MANAQGIRAGAAFVELFADDSRLVKGLQAASRRLKDWGQSVTALGKKMLATGAAALGAMGGAAKVFADMGSQLADMSLRTGASVEALSELGYAAEMSGGDMESLETGLRKMQKTIAGAASGSRSAQDALAKLGIALTTLQDLSPDQQFMLISDRLAKIPNPTQRAAAAMEVFGKSGTRLLPMMAEGARGLDAMRQKARDLGLVMSSEDAAAADAFGDLLDTLWKSMKMGLFAIGSALAPVLSDLAGQLMRVMKTVSAWIKGNQDLVATVFRVAAAVAAGGAALVVLGNLISGVGFACGTLAVIVMGLGAALGMSG